MFATCPQKKTFQIFTEAPRTHNSPNSLFILSTHHIISPHASIPATPFCLPVFPPIQPEFLVFLLLLKLPQCLLPYSSYSPYSIFCLPKYFSPLRSIKCLQVLCPVRPLPPTSSRNIQNLKQIRGTLQFTYAQ